MTTFAVDMTVSKLFSQGLANADHLDLEVQALASQRMVAVDNHIVAVEVTDGDDLHAAVRAGSVELHAHFQLVDAFEHAAVESGNQLGAVFAIGVHRLDGHVQLVAGLLAFEGLFQTDDDVASTVQIRQRRATGGAVDHLTGIVGQGIVDGDSLVSGDQHEVGPFAED